MAKNSSRVPQETVVAKRSSGRTAVKATAGCPPKGMSPKKMTPKMSMK